MQNFSLLKLLASVWLPLWPGWPIFESFWRKISLTKVAQIYGDYLGHFGKHHFLSKNACCYYYLAASGIFWATFYSNTWSHLKFYFVLLRLVRTSSEVSNGWQDSNLCPFNNATIFLTTFQPSLSPPFLQYDFTLKVLKILPTPVV